MISLLLLLFAGVLLLLAGFSIRRQFITLKRLRSQVQLPSDDRRYLRKQAYRRLFIGMLMIVLAGTFAWNYFTGMEKRVDELRRGVAENGEKLPVQPEDKDLLRLYSIYWIGVLGLLFLVVSCAIVDIWATRRYAWEQLRRIQSENRAMLERDLAMYRQQKINDRMR